MQQLFRRPNRAVALLILSLLLTAISSITADAAQRTSLDLGWRFHLAPSAALKNTVQLDKWEWAPAASADEVTAPANADWKAVDAGTNVFQGHGFAWFRVTLPALKDAGRSIHFDSIDDNATVFLNGKKLVYHTGWNDQFDIALDAAWSSVGPNVLYVLVENNDGPGGINKQTIVGNSAVVNHSKDAASTTFDDHAWRTVDVPHDYVLEGKFTPDADMWHGFLPVQPAWYRRTFTVPVGYRGKSVWVEFEGVFRDSVAYLNGHLLGEHQSGYTGFSYDIGKFANYGGKNVLSVYVDPRHFEGWWYEGGGIYRHVWLNAASPAHFVPMGTYVVSKLPEPKAPGFAPAAASLSIRTEIAAAKSTGRYTLASTIVDPAGKTIASTRSTVPAGGIVKQTAAVKQPSLWSIESPRLYTLRSELMQGEQVIDTQQTHFGIRTIRYDADTGFYLNGRPVKLKGTCNHQDFAGVGIGMTDSILYWRIKKLKEMGSNAYRCSHNPPAAALLDACDRLGMVVMDETRHLGDTYQQKTSISTGTSDLSDLAWMIKRDRNHPSVIMWSMANEEPLEGTKAGADIYTAMAKVVRKYDTTRPITTAMNYGWGDGFTLVEDLLGFNYAPDQYDKFHKLFPKLPIFGSETASITYTRGQYTTDVDRGFVFCDWVWPEAAWEPIASRPYVAGGFVWTGFDYKGEPTPCKWPDINSNFGAMDICGFPKDAYYYYQSVWGSKPIVHLLPHWNWAKDTSKPIHVLVFSNCPRVELFLNGRSLGLKDMPLNSHLEWSVPYEPGTLMARGYDASSEIVTVDKVETTGAPTALRLTTDRTRLTADGEDMTVVDVAVVDAQGRVVPTASNAVKFQVTGSGHVVGVGNGNPADHDPDKASARKAYCGLCMAIVGAGTKAGPIRLQATSPGLKPAAMAFTAGN